MRTQPLLIPGLAGPVVLATGFLGGRYSVTVGGVDAPRVGRNRYALPTAAGGTVEATVRIGLAEAYPRLEIAGVKHPTGPSVPLALRILAGVPVVLLIVGGGLGGGLGVLGVLVNVALLRQPISTAAKALSLVGVFIATFLVWLVIATAITLAVR